jgi:hypothetical protein
VYSIPSIMAPSYRRLQQYAIGISIISISYNGAEGAVSVVFGSESASRSLVFFGVQSAIEVISAAIVVWRFWRVARPGEEKDVRLGANELRQVCLKNITWPFNLQMNSLFIQNRKICLSHHRCAPPQSFSRN